MKVEKNPETPSQAIIKEANKTVEIKDSLGRTIEIKKMNALDRMRLFEIVGPDNVKNPAYMGYALSAMSIKAIDGEQIPRPATKAQVEALIQRLDDAVEEVLVAIDENFVSEQKEDFVEKVKN